MKNKNYVLSLLVTMFTLLPLFTASAYDFLWDYTLPVIYKPVNDVDPEPNPEVGGQRKPQRPLLATISQTMGVTLTGINKEELCSYEIYTTSGAMIVSVSSEEVFLDTLFSLTETEIEIRFILSDGYYSGLLNL